MWQATSATTALSMVMLMIVPAESLEPDEKI
jgi:hypothetical protein